MVPFFFVVSINKFVSLGCAAKHPEEKCQKIVKEQEFKIRKLKEKMAGIAPTKKNKAGTGSSAAPGWPETAPLLKL